MIEVIFESHLKKICINLFKDKHLQFFFSSMETTFGYHTEL